MHARVSPIIPFGAAKSNCYLCNGAPRTRGAGTERMIDTGVNIDFEGHIAICETCVTHMARLLGLFAPSDVEALAAELAEVLEVRVAQDGQIVRLVGIVEAQRIALADALGLDSIDDVAPEATVTNIAPMADPNAPQVS
jgi:hypothetical protein